VFVAYLCAMQTGTDSRDGPRQPRPKAGASPSSPHGGATSLQIWQSAGVSLCPLFLYTNQSVWLLAKQPSPLQKTLSIYMNARKALASCMGMRKRTHPLCSCLTSGCVIYAACSHVQGFNTPTPHATPRRAYGAERSGPHQRRRTPD